MAGEGQAFDVRLARTILGVGAIVAGTLILAFPGIAVDVIVALLAVGLMILGIISVFVGIRGIQQPTWRQIALPLGGLLALALGITAIVAPSVGRSILFILLAVGLMFYGVSRISTEALPADKPSGHRLFHGILGVVVILLALGVLLVPGLGEFALAAVLALILIIAGIAELVSGVQGDAPSLGT
ncbi:MAG: DUF308 domain-containing protein [Candidatus Thermoplasmatota archaeon]|nr:DUF308 domain-containing protein [Candidatus Thermoplasmatota archaeon]